MEIYKPLISIITIVYNDVSNIEETMLSVLNQSYSNIEYIVIDGKSTDGTYDIVKNYSNRLAYYHSEKDSGVYDAMNKGVAKAKGEWTIFMNSGDTFYDNNVLLSVFAKYHDKGESIICGDTYYFNRISGLKRHVTASLIGKRKYMPSNHQSTFTRTSELKAHRFELKYKVISDFAFYFDLYKRNSNYLIINKVISVYDDSGISSENKTRNAKEFMIFFFNRFHYLFFVYLLIYLKRVFIK